MPIKRTQETLKKTGVAGVYADGPNRFLVRAWFTDPKTGKQHKRESVATTFAEAVALKETLREAAPKTSEPTRLRFNAYAEQWLEALAPLLARSTRDRYVGALAILTVTFGDMYLDAIAVKDVRAWRDGYLKEHARATTNAVHRVLRQLLARAQEDGLVRGNAAKAVKSVPEKRTKGRRGRSFTASELQRFLSTVDAMKTTDEMSADIARMLVVLAFTGMRRGELFALRWTDVGSEELAIERSVYRREEKETKTDDPRRVAISTPLREALDEQRAWLRDTRHEGEASGLVFPVALRYARSRATRLKDDRLMWYHSPSCLDVPLRRAVKRAEVPEVSPHSFRRTWENLLRQAGVDEIVRRSLAGWRSTEAQEIYATSDVVERKRAVGLVASLVKGAGGADQHPAPTPGGFEGSERAKEGA